MESDRVPEPGVDASTTLLRADDMAASTAFWTAVLGSGPGVIDGEDWVQFHAGEVRIALAGTNRIGHAPAVLLKVADLAQARSRMLALGYEPGEEEEGLHERTVALKDPSGNHVVMYEPR